MFLEIHAQNCCLVTKLCLISCDPMDLSPVRFLSLWDFPDKNTGVGCHFLLQGIFLTQGLILSLLLAGVQLVKNLLAVQETPVLSLGWEDPLKKGMATPSRILAWKIPWTEKTGRLQSPWGLEESAGLSDFCFLSFLLAGRLFTSEPLGKL